jgi:hypothetical protein
VRNYYSAINEAELLICDSNYNEALTYFDSAFQQMFPWVIDISNAIYCAIDAADTSRLDSYVGFLLQKGLRFIEFDTPLYKRVIDFNPNLKQIIDSYNGPFLCQYVDSAFLKELKVRLDEDQRINRLRASMHNKRYSDLIAQAYIDSFSLILLKNGLWLKEWILNNGYPREACYYYPNAKSNPLHIISVLLVHYFSEHWTLFYPLKECVYGGELHPLDLVCHLLRHTPVKRENFKEYGHYCYLFMGNSIQLIEYKDIEEININREVLFLQPYEDYLRKIDYYFRNGNDKYNFRTDLGIMNFTDAATLENFLIKNYRNGIDNKQ